VGDAGASEVVGPALECVAVAHGEREMVKADPALVEASVVAGSVFGQSQSGRNVVVPKEDLPARPIR